MSFKYLMHPMELKKTNILKMTAKISMLRKHALFFWELNNNKINITNREGLANHNFFEASCLKLGCDPISGC